MDLSTPSYLLLCHVDRTGKTGRWQFVLRAQPTGLQFEAKDCEPDIQGDRLELLTVVRALESLDQPSRVTLVDCSEYVWKGVNYGLIEWRASDWRWEFFGQMVPVRNGDLWQRLDHALAFHSVECRKRRFDSPHDAVGRPNGLRRGGRIDWGIREKLSEGLKYAAGLLPRAWVRGVTTLHQRSRRWVARTIRPRTALPGTV